LNRIVTLPRNSVDRFDDVGSVIDGAWQRF